MGTTASASAIAQITEGIYVSGPPAPAASATAATPGASGGDYSILTPADVLTPFGAHSPADRLATQRQLAASSFLGTFPIEGGQDAAQEDAPFCMIIGNGPLPTGLPSACTLPAARTAVPPAPPLQAGTELLAVPTPEAPVTNTAAVETSDTLAGGVGTQHGSLTGTQASTALPSSPTSPTPTRPTPDPAGRGLPRSHLHQHLLDITLSVAQVTLQDQPAATQLPRTLPRQPTQPPLLLSAPRHHPAPDAIPHDEARGGPLVNFNFESSPEPHADVYDEAAEALPVMSLQRRPQSRPSARISHAAAQQHGHPQYSNVQPAYTSDFSAPAPTKHIQQHLHPHGAIARETELTVAMQRSHHTSDGRSKRGAAQVAQPLYRASNEGASLIERDRVTIPRAGTGRSGRHPSAFQHQLHNSSLAGPLRGEHKESDTLEGELLDQAYPHARSDQHLSTKHPYLPTPASKRAKHSITDTQARIMTKQQPIPSKSRRDQATSSPSPESHWDFEWEAGRDACPEGDANSDAEEGEYQAVAPSRHGRLAQSRPIPQLEASPHSAPAPLIRGADPTRRGGLTGDMPVPSALSDAIQNSFKAYDKVREVRRFAEAHPPHLPARPAQQVVRPPVTVLETTRAHNVIDRAPPQTPDVTTTSTFQTVSLSVPTGPREHTKQPKPTDQHRVDWSEEEVQAIVHGVQKFGVGAWAKVLEFSRHVFQPKRTSVSLKDKWRNLHAKAAKYAPASPAPAVPHGFLAEPASAPRQVAVQRGYARHPTAEREDDEWAFDEQD